jgi:hypothetical protein
VPETFLSHPRWHDGGLVAFATACVLGLVLIAHRYYDSAVLVFVFIWALERTAGPAKNERLGPRFHKKAPASSSDSGRRGRKLQSYSLQEIE